jgi:hypothetical protein
VSAASGDRAVLSFQVSVLGLGFGQFVEEFLAVVFLIGAQRAGGGQGDQVRVVDSDRAQVM